MRHFLACGAAAAAALFVASVPAAAWQAQPAAPAPTAEERERLTAAVQRGRLLFELVRAAQLTTQDMLARIADPEAAGITGWIAEREGNGTAVIYYADGEDGPVAVYRGQVVGARVATRDMFEGDSRPALTPTHRRMAAARAAVAGLDRKPCPDDGTFNVVVIPPASADAAIDVYKLSPQTARNRYPAGGHFLATVAPDGSIASERGFTNRCLDLELADAPAAGAQPPPVAVTHLLDPLPTEIHVFLSLWMNRPLLVATGEPERVWAVREGRVGLLSNVPAIPPPGPGR